MSLIIEEPSGKKKLISQLIYDTIDTGEKEGTLYFYKLVWSGNSFGNGATMDLVMEEAREMVEDLIY